MENALTTLAQAQASAAQLEALLLKWREPLLALMLVGECMPLVGFAAPGLIALALAGFIAVDLGPFAGIRLFLIACAAIFFTDLGMFAMGRLGSRRSALVARFVGPRAAFGKELQRQPDRWLLFYQFPPYARMFAPVLLGNVQLEWRRWLAVSTLATLIFVVTFFGLGVAAALLHEKVAGVVAASGLLIFISMSGLLVWCLGFAGRLWRARGIDVRG
jgi:membrane protein DedA with SNARE-associated domain